MSKKEIEAAGGAANIIEIPATAGAVVPAYNLPGVAQEVKFTGEVIADIYAGKINKWNDPRLTEINAGVNLPNLPITPAWRTDGSGTTFVFTSYLATQSEEFKGSIGMGKQVKWPIGQGGKGNEGVAAIVSGTPGALGYIEENYADANKISYGSVKNKSGKFVKASAQTVSAAGLGAVDTMKGNLVTADIWNRPGDESYPIAAFTYLLTYKDLKNVKTEPEAQALVDFLWWATHDGQQMAGSMGYAPLGDGVQKKVEGALGMFTFQGKPMKAKNAK
jgi:phosphate transport system substrate-binding protein